MSITRPLGFRASACAAGIKKSGKPDLALIVCDDTDANSERRSNIVPRRSSAAVFTRNVIVGAPVEIGRAWRAAVRPRGERPPFRAILVNAGCSNAATGQDGIDDAQACMSAVADAIRSTPGEVMPSSTGVIGHRLPVEKMRAAIPRLAKNLTRGDEADTAAAGAIMTTDLVAKSAHRELQISGHTVHLGAIAKGSGMIAPRLDSAGGAGGAPALHATMLVFITTDAAIEGPSLQEALEATSRESFDRISVDAHPSCSDTVLVMASGAAPIRPIHRDMPEFHGFKAALASLCTELAEKIIRDGEGASRIFRVSVRGAAGEEAAMRIARAIVDSPLVKCAIHGKDPNWGRIVTAAGNAEVPFNPATTSLSIGGVEVYHGGRPTGLDRKDARVAAAMSAPEVFVELTVGNGPGSGWMIGCDLSREYVGINADYTT